MAKETPACRPYCFPDISRMGQAVGFEEAGRFTRMPAEGAAPGGKARHTGEDDAAQAEKRAFEAGYQQGHAAAGRELSDLMAGLRRALDDLNRRQAELYRQVEGESVRLALAVARKIVLQELKTDPGIVARVVREALETLADTHRPTVHLHPEDAARVRSLQTSGEQSFAEGSEGVRIEADDSISRGGCRVCSGPTELDATVESRLQVLASAFEALLPAAKDAAGEPEQGHAR